MMFLLFLTTCFADLQSLYGIGSSSTALIGSNRAIPYEATSSLYNPAMQNLYNETQLNIGWIHAATDFEQPKNIVIENEFIGGSNTNNTGDVDTNVDDTSNLFISSVFLFKKGGQKRTIGVHISVPTDKLVSVETQSAYYPQYAMYFADTQRLTLNTAYAWTWGDNFHVGLGFNFYMTTGSTIQTTLPASDTNNPRTSTVDIKLEVKPNIAPVLGMIWNPDNHFFAFNYMGERDAEMVFDAKNNVNVLSTSPIPVNFVGSSSLYYDPEVFSLGYSYQGVTWDFHSTVDWERWSKFSGSSVIMQFDSNTSFEQFIEPSDYEDIITPKIGFTYKYDDKNEYYLGMGYRPSPVPKPKGNLNYVDSDRYIVGIGYGRKLDGVPLLSDGPSKFMIHFQMHSLKDERVEKSGNDIGAPGYDVGGTAYTAGFSWNILL